jgi:hypothetical protein
MFSFPYYAYSLILLTQWYNLPCSLFSANASIITASNNQQVCIQTGNDVLNYFGVNANNFGFNISMLMIMIVGFHLVAFLVIVIRVRRAA